MFYKVRLRSLSSILVQKVFEGGHHIIDCNHCSGGNTVYYLLNNMPLESIKHLITY